MGNKDRIKRIGISGAVTLIYISIFFKIAYSGAVLEYIKGFIGNFNIFIYAAGLITGAAVLALVDCVDRIYEYILEHGVFLGISLLLIASWADIYIKLVNVLNFNVNYAWYAIQKRKLILLALLTGIVLFLLLKYVKNPKQKRLLKAVTYTSGIIVLIWLVYAVYSPDIINSYYQLVHTDAIFSPVYNAYHNEPISSTSYGIYGHYALLLNIIFKVTGLSLDAFQTVMIILLVLIHVMFLYCLLKITHNRVVQIVSIISVLIFYGNTQYIAYQGVIRLFFTLIIMAWLVWLSEKKILSVKLQAITYALVVLAIIWNTETGILAGISCSVFFIYRLGGLDKKFFINLVKHAALCLLSFLTAWGSVSVHNIFFRGGC